jgi:hypothetical protein
MKHFILLTLGMFFLATFTDAQTTWIDYRYVTAGLKDDLAKGKDIKPGYSLQEIGSEASVTQQGVMRYAKLYYFRNNGQNKAFVVACRDSRYNFSYFCIPSSDAASDIWKEAFNAISKSGQEWQLVFSWALARVVSQRL